MPVVPGTQVQISFYTFPTQYPPLYYAANEGTLNLASVNAGNSQALYVGGGGVNQAFEGVLGVTQKHVSDYQTRHSQLVDQAGVGGTASAAYPATDPCAFSYVNATQVSQTPKWHEGVCFVDVFDPKLAPHGNAKNMAMLYIAPPFGDHYASDAAFLAAIQATTTNIIATVAGYNALAPAQNLPLIEALRNTLFSSVIYNRCNQTVKPPICVPAASIAGAILAGFAAGLHAHPQCGLKELQFPVGSATDPLFASLQQAIPAGPPPVMVLDEIVEDVDSDDEDEDDDPDATPPDANASPADVTRVKVQGGPVDSAAAKVRFAIQGLDRILNPGQVDPTGHYQSIAGALPPEYENTVEPHGL